MGFSSTFTCYKATREEASALPGALLWNASQRMKQRCDVIPFPHSLNEFPV
jgi:hypothetical protein